jgi:hypothetical protein
MLEFDQRVIERRFGRALGEFVFEEDGKINSRMMAYGPRGAMRQQGSGHIAMLAVYAIYATLLPLPYRSIYFGPWLVEITV